MTRITIAVGLTLLIASSCTKNYLPKPLGYNRLNLPEHTYQDSPDSLPYRFQYSQSAELLPDTVGFREPYWILVNYPDLKATIHLTYKRIGSEKELREFFEDAYTLASKHQIRAYAIEETIVTTPYGKKVVIAEIAGEVPSQFQFTLSDSTRHWLHGAVYFNTQVNNDSLQPAIEYIKIDAMQLINSLRWESDLNLIESP